MDDWIGVLTMLVGDGSKLIRILIIIDYRFVALPETRNKQESNPSMVVLKNSLPRSDGLGYSDKRERTKSSNSDPGGASGSRTLGLLCPEGAHGRGMGGAQF